MLKYFVPMLAPRYREDFMREIMSAVTQNYRYILLDSGKRARTFAQTDGKQLQNDLFLLRELASG